MMNEFIDAVGDWESRDDWQFTDKSAERLYFFNEGKRAGMNESWEIAAKRIEGRHITLASLASNKVLRYTIEEIKAKADAL